MFRTLLLLVVVATAAVPALAVPANLVAESWETVVLGDKQMREHRATIVCDESRVGLNTYEVIDPATGAKYHVDINCARPQWEYDMALRGYTPRSGFTLQRGVCLSRALDNRDTGQARVLGDLPHNRRFSTMSVDGEPAYDESATRHVQAQFTREQASQGLEFTGALVAFSNPGLGAAMIGAGALLGGGGSGQKKFDKYVVRALHDLQSEVGDLHSMILNTNTRLDNDELIIGEQTKFDDFARQALINNQHDISALQGEVSQIANNQARFVTWFQNNQTVLRNALKSELTTLTEVWNATEQLHEGAEQQIAKLANEAQRISTAVRELAQLVYQEAAQQEYRRLLTTIYHTDQKAGALDGVIPVTTDPFVRTDGQTPLTFNELLDNVRQLSGARSVGSVLVQGTVLDGGKYYAVEYNLEIYADPVVALDTVIPTASFRDLIDLIGGDYADGTACTVAKPHPYGQAGLNNSYWNCKAIAVVSALRCEIGQGATGVVADTPAELVGNMFPFDWTDDPAREIQSLRRQWQQLGEATPAGCVAGTLHPVPTHVGWYQGGVPANPKRSLAELELEWEGICDGPGSGTWVTHNATTHPSGRPASHGGELSSMRFARETTKGYQDFYLDPANTNYSCNMDPAEFMDGVRNMGRFAYHAWINMQQDYQSRAVTQFAAMETEIYGKLPSGMVFDHRPFGHEKDSNVTARCEIMTYARLANSGDVDYDHVRLYQLQPKGGLQSPMSITVRSNRTGQESTTLPGANSRGQGNIPNTNLADGKLTYAQNFQIDNEMSQLLPGPELVVEGYKFMQEHGMVFDVRPEDLSDSASASARAHKASYVFIPATASDVATDAKRTTPITRAEYDTHYLAPFDPRLIGDFPMANARQFSNGECGSLLHANGTSLGDTPTDNRMCALFRNYHWTPVGDGNTFRVAPKSGWSVTVEVGFPVGELTNVVQTACPTYKVTAAASGDADVVLYGQVAEPFDVCLQVVGGATAHSAPDYQRCNGTVERVTIPTGASGLSRTYSASGDQAHCQFQWLQVTEVQSEGVSCSLADLNPQGACFHAPGLSLVTSSRGASGNDHVSSAVSSAITEATDRLLEGLADVANSATDIAHELQQIPHMEDTSDAAIEAAVRAALQKQANTLRKINTGNTTILNKIIANQEANINATTDKIANDAKTNAALFRNMSAAIANMSSLATENAELKANFTALEAKYQADNAQFRADFASLEKAYKDVKDDGDLSFGFLGKLLKMPEDLFNGALGGLGKLLTGLLDGVVTVLICGLVIYGCFILATKLMSRHKANRATIQISRLSDTSGPKHHSGAEAYGRSENDGL